MTWARLLLFVGTVVAAHPAVAWAGEPEHGPLQVPGWSILPFAALLLAIALMPMFMAEFWHSHLRKALVSVLLSLPVIAFLFYVDYSEGQPAVVRLGHAVAEYVQFILLLGSLYVVAGGIVVQGDFRPTPLVNTAILLIGAMLANVIGTTGASVLLIRPMLRINVQRQRNSHIPVFFIFAVSNLGGLLTPLGDPPLFLGFLSGVDFFWTLRLFPHWAVAVGSLLAVFFVWDFVQSRREPPLPVTAETAAPLRVQGLINVVFLVGIILAVLLQSSQVTGGALPYSAVWSSVLMAAMGLLSWLFTSADLRRINDFSWEAIIEVAVLFVGIFITMVPALELLSHHRAELGVTEPWQFFWLTGALSSFLDNAPTYMTFAAIARPPVPGDFELASLAAQRPLILAAISAGAVFMGANTYIGNGPNFMVKAIAEGAGYRMPSFFGYMVYSGLILLPIFGLVTWLFFI